MDPESAGEWMVSDTDAIRIAKEHAADATARAEKLQASLAAALADLLWMRQSPRVQSHRWLVIHIESAMERITAALAEPARREGESE
jgi:hypothetical protein